MPEIFISYSSANESDAKEIKNQLDDNNITSFLAPESIEPGVRFEDALREALREAKELWVLYTPQARSSQWVAVECAAAWGLGLRTVSILLRCEAETLPPILSSRQAVDRHNVNALIKSYLSKKDSVIDSHSASRQWLIFDIDGTVLDPLDTIAEGTGKRFMESLVRLATHGYSFIFITGNNFQLQRQRILNGIVSAGLGSNVFCFTDGGTRAFSFNGHEFQEIQEYSKENTISRDYADNVTRIFEGTLKRFLQNDGNDVLSLPNVEWHQRTLDYLGKR